MADKAKTSSVNAKLEQAWQDLLAAVSMGNYTAAWRIATALRKLTSGAWTDRWRDFDAKLAAAFGCSQSDYDEVDKLRMALDKLAQENSKLSRECMVASDEANEAVEKARSLEEALKGAKKRIQELEKDLSPPAKKPEKTAKASDPEEKLRVCRRANELLISQVRKLQDQLGLPKSRRKLDADILKDPDELDIDELARSGETLAEPWLDDLYPETE